MAPRGISVLTVCLVVTYIGVVYVECQRCPKETIPYPSHRPEDPDSCYVFLGWWVTMAFWKHVWKYRDQGKSFHEKMDLNRAIWTPNQARRLCKELSKVKVLSHLSSFDFRLPIIESQDEDYWLYDYVGNRTTDLGTNFWIDLEYDPINEHYYWASTMDEPDVYFPPEPEQLDPAWVESEVVPDTDEPEVKICFEYNLNLRQMKLRGWHRRACAQAYEKIHYREDCTRYIKGISQTDGPVAYQDIPRLLAPTTAVCEYSLYPEPKKPPDKPCCSLKGPGAGEPVVTRPKPGPATRPPKGQATINGHNAVILMVTMGLVNRFCL